MSTNPEISLELKSAIETLMDSSRSDRYPVPLSINQSKALLSALAPELVAQATVEMPEEPGLYLGRHGVDGVVFRLGTNGDLRVDRNGRQADPSDGPFRRLIVEDEAPASSTSDNQPAHVFTPEELSRTFFMALSPAPWQDLAEYVNEKGRGAAK